MNHPKKFSYTAFLTLWQKYVADVLHNAKMVGLSPNAIEALRTFSNTAWEQIETVVHDNTQ